MHSLVTSCYEFVNKNIFSIKYFFSIIIKLLLGILLLINHKIILENKLVKFGKYSHFQSMPFWYPANRIEFLNGTKYTNKTSLPHTEFLIGLQGMVPHDEYSTMVRENHYGKPTPMDFSGFNPRDSPHGYFPFWSSESYTYATTMLALSKYSNLE